MAAIRLIPLEEAADFPYEAVLKKLRDIDGLQLRPADLTKMIEVGKRMGWPAEMIAANEELARRGTCFEFRQFTSPYIQGTLYEDNIFFTMLDDNHGKVCKPVIEELARELKVRVLMY